jgi:superfamily I DNA and/or RNA helicase
VLAKEIPDFSSNPIKYIGITSANYFDNKEIKNEFAKFQEEYDDLIYSIQRIVNRIGISVELNQDIILEILGSIDISVNNEIYRDSIVKYFNEFDNTLIDKLFGVSASISKDKKENPNIDFNKAMALNAKERTDELANVKGFFKKISLKSKCKKELNDILNGKAKGDLISIYQAISKYQDNYNYIDKNSSLLNELIGFNYIDNLDDYQAIKEKYDNTFELSNHIKKLDELGIEETLSTFTRLNESKDKDIIDSINEINVNSDKFAAKEKALSEKYKIKYELMNMESYNRFLGYMSNDLEVSLLLTMTKINEILEKLDSLGLKVITDNIINNRINIDELDSIYNKSLSDGYIRIYFMDDDINYFNPQIFDAEIAKYRKLINDYNNYAIEEVSARISNKLIHDSIKYMDSSPIGRLKKAIQSQGRGTTIRETLREFDDVIKSYFPVFLMSPLSVAQYLAIDDEFKKGVSKFDIVIFDEASQIPTHEAIGSIARGNSLVVAGDPNQMPPSSYFQTGITISDDDIEFIDAYSLLNECLAIDLPRHRLKFHYRSHHESLIKFSNDNFYDSSLYTFPSVDSKDFKVHFEYVKTKEEKKNSNISKDETDAIINKIKEIYSNPANHGKSLGIIVFNITQEETLENRLQTYLFSNPELRKELAYSEELTGEPYFIKSLENVQGDERDIIIISIGFRKNALGRPYINGPLVRTNGEKRLNVAVSRSKEEMYIVSTIKFADFESDERIQSEGAKLLKKFLGYAEFNSFNSVINENNKERLADLIKEDLKQYEIDAECGIGSGSVKIDLALKKKDDPNYSLGVIIDNSIAFNNLSLRDRLYVNEYVLNNLKWKIINVYSVEYFKNKKAVIDKIIKALDDPYVKKQIEINPNIRKENVEVINLKPLDYMDSILIKAKYDKEKGFNHLDINLDSIVKTEGPVSLSKIKKIIRDNYGLKSITKSISDLLEEALIKKYLYTIDQNGEKFFFIEQNSYMSNFRLAGGRDIYEVSKEELACAMREIIKIQGDLDTDDLYKAVLDAFKFDTKVLNKRIRERLDYVYEYGQKERIIN